MRVERPVAANRLVDVMDGSERWQVDLGQLGWVALVDAMPRLVPIGPNGATADVAIVQAARVSYGAGTKTPSEDADLLRYLMRHRHTTPFEMVEFKFHCRLPVFVARQWIRHRTASVNEVSGRYSVLPDLFYRPEGVRRQSAANKQGSDGVVGDDAARDFLEMLRDVEERAYQGYLEAVGAGVSRELARICLPASIMTEWYWKIDLHNLLHFLALRLAPDAQEEIRSFAEAMLALIRPIVPETVRAFEDYRLGAVTLTRLEVEAIRAGTPLDSINAREQREYAAKRELLGLEGEVK